jgi:Polysaccharide lyase
MDEMQCSGAYPDFKVTVGPQNWDAPFTNPWSFAAPTPTDLEVQLRSGDVSAWDKAHDHIAERAEVDGYAYPQGFNTDFWLEMDLTINPGEPVTSQWCVLGQLHPMNTPGSPIWSQEFDSGDVFKIMLRYNTDLPLTLFTDAKCVRGQSYHMLYHFRVEPQPSTTGWLACWRDGVQIVKYQGPFGYTDSVGPYFKFGIYRDPSPETLIVQYKNLKIGPTSS